jgi:hypothetical protein
MEKFLLLSVIAIIFLVAWIATKKGEFKMINKIVKSKGGQDTFNKIGLEPERALKLRKPVSGILFRKVWPATQIFEVSIGGRIFMIRAFNLENAIRKARHQIMVENLDAQGITWLPTGLYSKWKVA